MKLHTRSKLLFATLALSCLMLFPAHAAETKAEYRTEAATTRTELQEVKDELKTLQEENSAIAEKYRAVRTSWKENQSLPISEENWEKAKELRAEIKAIRDAMPENTAPEQRASIKAAVENEDYTAALSTLDQLLETKKAALEPRKEINRIWKEIEELLQ